jgi:predicted DNA-binding transcriptional regulator AlpA
MTSEATQRNKVGRPRKDPNAPPKPKGIPHELAHFDELPDSAHVREPVVRGLLGGVSNSTVWRAVREGKLPAPVKLCEPPRVSWRPGGVSQTIGVCSVS